MRIRSATAHHQSIRIGPARGWTWIATAMLTASFALVACEQEGPVEETLEEVDEAAESAGENLEDAADSAGDAVEEAADEMEEEVDKATTE